MDENGLHDQFRDVMCFVEPKPRIILLYRLEAYIHTYILTYLLSIYVCRVLGFYASVL